MKIKSKIKLISIFSIPVATLSLTSIAASCTNNNVQNKPEQPSDSETNTPSNSEENNGENSETNTENPTKPEGDNNETNKPNEPEDVVIVIKTLKGLKSTPAITYDKSNNVDVWNSYRVITYAKEKNNNNQNVNVQYFVNSLPEKVKYIDKLDDEQSYVYKELLKERKNLIDLAYKSPVRVVNERYDAYQFKNKLADEDSFIYPLLVSKFIYTIDFMLKDPGYLTKQNLDFIVGDRSKNVTLYHIPDTIHVLEQRIINLIK